MKIIFSIALLGITIISASAQISGNGVFNRNSSESKRVPPKILALNDSSFLIQANIIMNVAPDSYVITLGVSDSSNSVSEANRKINLRISNLTTAISRFDIKKQDLFVDMTTQTRLYDFELRAGTMTEVPVGFEIKKNIILRTTSIASIDELLSVASKYAIYDLVKVDYVVNDLNKINRQLFNQAVEIISQKKAAYVAVTGMSLQTASQVYAEDYYSNYPDQLYKSYTPSGTTIYSTESRTNVKTIVKSPTFYYDPQNYSGIDKVITTGSIEPTVEFGLSLQIKYYINRQR